jgi:hypothetical protein
MPNAIVVSRAAAPLLSTARLLDWARRRAYLDDLRTDAPSLIAEVERCLALESAVNAEPPARTSSVSIAHVCLQYLRKFSPSTPH